MGFVRYVKIAGLVILVAGGVMVVRHMLTKDDRKLRMESSDEDKAKKQHSIPLAEEPERREHRPDMDQDQQEFAIAAARFEGLYTALQRAATGKVTEARRFQILREWDGRIRRSEQPNLTVVWLDLLIRTLGTIDPASLSSPDPAPVMDLLKTWYSRLIRWGLTRDDRQQFVISEASLNDYSLEGDYQIGQNALIELPCWKLQGQVVERGLAHTESKGQSPKA